MSSKEKEVLLPTTERGFEMFVQGIIKDFSLPDSEDIHEAIATMIMHLDSRIGRMKRSYFADGAVKFLANKAAFAKLTEIDQRRQAEAEAAKKAGEADAGVSQ